MTTDTMTLVCHKCGKDNPSEAKRCGNRSCQAWFQSPKRTNEWKQKNRESNKKYWHRDMPLPEGKKHQTPEEVIAWYAEVGWSCVVVWEDEISDFIETLKEVK